jgi:hypothetical protein
MVDRDGNVHDVPAAQASALFRSGNLGFAPDAAVPVDTGGQIQLLSGAEAGKALLTDFSATATGQEDLANQTERREMAGVGHTLAAAGIGAGNALTLGFGKAAAAGAGQLIGGDTGQDAVEDYIRRSERQHGTAMGLGEVGGFLAPLVFSGGTSLAARGAAAGETALGRGAVAASERSLLARGVEATGNFATAPMRAVSSLGEGAANLAERGAVAAGLDAGGASVRVLRGAAQGAAEMPFYSVGQAVSDATIHDKDLTAEQLVAAAGHGALFGAVGGGALSVAGQLLAGGGKLAVKAGERAGELASSLGVDIPKSLGEVAERKAIQSTGANLRQIEALEGAGMAETRAKAARMIVEDLPKELGEKPGAILSHARQAEAAVSLETKIGQEVRGSLRAIDEAGIAKPSVEAIVDGGRAIAERLEATPLAEKEARAIRRSVESFEKKAGEPTFEELWEMRKRLDKTINFKAAGEGNSLEQAKLEFRRLIESTIEKDAAKASAELGAEHAATYAKAKSDFRAATWIREATEKGAASEARNRSVGLSEQLGALGGFTLGGGGIPGLVAGAASSVAQNLVRRYGDQVVASLAHQAIRTDMVNAISKTFGNALSERAASYVSREALASRVAAAPGRGAWLAESESVSARQTKRDDESLAKQYAKTREQLASVTPASLEHRTAGLADAPGLRAAVVQQATVARDFLASKMPPAPPEAHPLQPGASAARPPSPAEMQKFIRYSRAVDDPMSVLDDLHEGRLNRESVEALKAVYPKIYGEVQGAVLGAISQRRQALSYQQEVQLGTLLGVPTNPSMRPQAIAAAQSIYAQQPPPPSPGPKAPKEPKEPRTVKPFDISSSTMSRSQSFNTPST